MTTSFQKPIALPELLHSQPRVMISENRAAYLGPGMRLSPHKLSVATIVFALERPFELKFIEQAGECNIQRRIGLIPPDTLHHLRTEGTMLFLYLDALGDDYGALDLNALDVLNSDANGITTRLCEAVSLRRDVSSQIGNICKLLKLPHRNPPDSRIALAMRAIDCAPQDFTSISMAAQIAGMSVSRFQYLFKEVTGTAFRRYRLWKRLSFVARSLSLGESLTVAALDAGFSSSAHLSSTFRSIFGIKPSDLIAQDVQIVVDPVMFIDQASEEVSD